MADELSLRHQVFINLLTTPKTPTYLNLTRSYMGVYPRSSYNAARAHAVRLVSKGNIREAMVKQLSIDQMGNKLKKYLRAFEKGENLQEARKTIMDYAELTGQLVRKSETKIDDVQRHEIRSAVKEIMAQRRQNVKSSTIDRVASTPFANPSTADQSATGSPTMNCNPSSPSSNDNTSPTVNATSLSANEILASDGVKVAALDGKKNG
jgi:hypothetical protein